MSSIKQFNKQVIVSCSIVTVTMTIVIASCFLMFQDFNRKQVVKTEMFLKQNTLQYKATISKQIHGDLETLQGFASALAEQSISDKEKMLKLLKNENENNRFRRMGYLDKNGISYIFDIDGREFRNIDYSENDDVKQVLNGEQVVTSTIKDDFGDGYINRYYVPMYYNNEIIGALSATNDADVYREILDLPSLGMGFASIINENGDLILRSKEDIDTEYMSVLDLDFEDESTKQVLLENLKSSKEGSYLFKQNGVTYLAYYEPLGINDWSVVSVVPESILTEDTAYASKMLTICILVVFILSIMVLIYILHLINKSKNSLEKIAYYDELTNVYTKRKFILEASKKVKEDSNYTLTLIDVSNFKIMNELFGRQKADQFLVHMGKILKQHTSHDELYYRHTSNCFGVLWKTANEAEVIVRLENLIEAMHDYKFDRKNTYNVHYHCGIIHGMGKEEDSIETIIDRAMMALSECKKHPKKLYYFYDTSLLQTAQQDAQIQSNMENALKNNEFEVYFQPQYDFKTNRIIGAEALTRWRKDGKIIMPNDFIPIFEKQGTIVDLDMHMLDKVCHYIKIWEKEGFDSIRISVNQSRLLFYLPDYIDRIKNLIDKHQIKPTSLLIEITESVASNEVEVLENIIEQIHELGVGISIDDFGSGYSSLSILQHLSFDELKLDQTFIRKKSDNENKQKIIVQKIIELSKTLNIKTVAEGVETNEQREFLQKIGCDIAQGYYFSKPITKADFEVLLKKTNS